jgi:translocation and assembly module TamB
MADHATAANVQPAPGPAPRTGRSRLLVLALLLPIAALLGIVTAAALVLATPAGSRLAIEWASARLQGALSVENLRGTAWSGLSAERVRWTDPALSIEIDDPQIRLDWSGLLRGALVIEQVRAGSLRVARPATSSPAALPASLGLPRPIEIRSLEIATLTWREGPGRVIAAGPISASASYNTGRYRIDALQAQASGVRLSEAQIELHDQAPFAIAARGRLAVEPAQSPLLKPVLRARLPEESLTLDIRAAGSLAHLQLAADARYAGVRARAQWSGDPLAARVERPLEVSLDEIDSARFLPDAPRVLIAGTLRLRPADAVVEIDLTNSAPGRIDEQRLPVGRVRGELAWRDQRVSVTGLEIGLGAAAQIKGSIRWGGAETLRLLSRELPAIDAELRVEQLDLAELRAGWPASRIDASVRLERERLQVVLPDVFGDRKLAVSADVRLEDEQARVEKMEAILPYARAQLAGSVQLSGAQPFSIAGSLAGVDPRRVLEHLGLDAPAQAAGELNGEVQLRGALGGAPRVDARLALRESRIAGQRLTTSATASYRHDTRRMGVDARLDWGGNGLTLRGSVGASDDRLGLNARFDRPGLFDQRLSGSLRIDAELSGPLERVRLALKATSPRLAVAGAATLADTELTVEAGDLRALAGSLGAASGLRADQLAGNDPARRPDTVPALLVARLVAREVQIAGERVQTLRAAITGSPDAHAFQMAARVANQAISLSGQGRLVQGAAPGWSARLDALSVDGWVSARLLEPAEVGVGGGVARIERFSLGADGGVLSIDEASWSAAGLTTRGEARGLSLRPLVDWLEGGANSRPTSAQASAAADARGEAAERLRSLQLNARWALAGPAWDTLDGDFSASLRAPASDDPVIGNNRVDIRLAGGRLDGEARVAIPSLRFSRRYTAPDWTLDGELLFSGRVRGTLRSPELVGALQAEHLMLFNRSLGWRLREGRIEARFDGRALTIDTIRFAGGDGSMTIKGVLRLIDQQPGALRGAKSSLPVEGQLQLEARRLPVPLGPGQRLLLSGLTDLIAAGGELQWRGQLRADEGLIELRSGGVPDLPADIRIVGEAPARKAPAPAAEAVAGWTPRVGAELTIALGEALRVRGGGVDARLGGELTLTGFLPAAPRVRGQVDVREGTFSAYGRRLEISRGVIRFAGELDNPVLDILAMRRDQQVEAGVSVTGSALAPRLRLVSEPDLPDAQKLSWLVLGTGLDDVSNAGQARALSEAALALLGRSDEGLMASLTQRLGIDAVSLGATGSNPADRLGTARLGPPMAGVAGSSSATGAAAAGAMRQEVVTVSKRLSSRLTLSYERGLSGLWNLVRLQYDISRRLSLRAQSGSENALDLLYFWWFD